MNSPFSYVPSHSLICKLFRKMKNYYFYILVIILGLSSCQSMEDEEIFTIYLVRHAEKVLSSGDSNDPDLTLCGAQRAEAISEFLSDVKLDVIYSTDYIRTQNTAGPTALSKELELVKYDPNELEAFSKALIDRKQDALVVGHSNTTGVLAGLLVGEEIGEFDTSIYNRIYQVVICKDKSRLHVLHTAFTCEDSIRVYN